MEYRIKVIEKNSGEQKFYACQDTNWKYRVRSQGNCYWTNEIAKDSSGCIEFYTLRGFNDSISMKICGTYEIQKTK